MRTMKRSGRRGRIEEDDGPCEVDDGVEEHHMVIDISVERGEYEVERKREKWMQHKDVDFL